MSTSSLDLLDDDDFVFEPTAWDLAFSIGLGFDPEKDPLLLDELVDAMLMHVDHGPLLERLTDEAMERIWDDELAAEIRTGLVRLTSKEDWAAAASAALVEFDRDPAAAEVSREVVITFAMQIGQEDHPVFFCLCCIEETLPSLEPADRRALARRAAILARRNTAISVEEIQAALANAHVLAPAARLATDERRRAVRARLGRLGELGRESMPQLAVELQALANEPLPDLSEEDDVWEEVCNLLLADVARPDLN